MLINSLPKNRICPVCYSASTFFLSHLSFSLFDGTPISGELDLIACSHCGFLYYDTPSKTEDFDVFYRDYYLINSYSLRENHPAESAYLAETVEIIRQLGVLPNAFIVDVGCGSGSLLKKLREAGFCNLFGIELCDEYVDQIIKIGINACVGSATKLPSAAKKADCLIYKNIFEHFLEFDTVLDQIEAFLSPQGLIVVEVPNAAFYGESSGYQPLSYFTLEHINHFDHWHLEYMFYRRGFEMIKSGTRMLDIAERYPIPVQYGIFRRFDKESLKDFTIKSGDFDLLNRVQSWLSPQAKFNSDELELLKKAEIPIHIWGLSYRTMAWLSMSTLKECYIAGFYDSDIRKQKKKLMGQLIKSPDLLKSVSDNEAIVIGVGPSSSIMMQLLIEWGFSGKIVTLH